MDSIRLRALEMSDLELLKKIENDPRHWSVGNTLAPWSHQALSMYIRQQAESDIYTTRQLKLVVEQSEHAIGLIDLFNYEPRHDRIEMGVALVTEMRGKGLSVPVVQRCLAYLREVLHIRSVYCVVSESNTASKQMLLKAGFVQSGVLQDWCRVADGYESAVVYQCLL